MRLSKEEKPYTYADYLTYPEGERWEIMNGAPYMQAAPAPIHQAILMELAKQIAVYLTGKPCRIYPAPFCVRLPQGYEKNDIEVKNVVEPDISIICDKSKIDDKGCNGAPDMVIEIISPASIKTDRVIKFNLYEKAGVQEYWIVEPEQRMVSVFQLQKNGRFSRPEMYTDEDSIRVSLFADLEIDMGAVFAQR
ncbi:Uma2 family endonuclease [Desulfosporosinus lacus]|uniref:Endonuclease, Uma2 family (Restriction endonuclease fold) n=1 Tax=Desulfosporosinus lacus DSM 15449 TaxID=1121420 RepID=A0A1M5S4D6_9FIRM|nr:Uma2 family endonuclease [Desulfosporosinus lacus]SHH33346.1 Endonuclease, Uma2 family (restriction endonuclease fold) [Desulfosporosinus lacus DSM 15449]